MMPELQLCPCCAAHLRVPPQLHVMRCNNCDAELVFISEGGVRGLAYLPDVSGIVPYSDPAQRGRTIHGHFDGRELLDFRRGIVLADAARKQRFWGGLFFGSMILLLIAAFTGIFGAEFVAHGPKENVEASALAFLAAFLSLPLIAYMALYFHGRARLARESVHRWR